MDHVSCQPFLDRLTHILIKTRLIEEFAKKSSSEDKLRFCLSHSSIKYGGSDGIQIRNEVRNLLSGFKNESSKHRKCEEMSLKLKERGSKAYLKRKDKDAHSLYSEALRHAPHDSKIIPLLYANRSATLFQMEDYQNCLDDIERAKKSSYPIEMMHKILKRKASCLARLARHAEAFDTFNIFKKSLCKISLDNKDKFSSSIKSLEEELGGLNLVEPPELAVESTLPQLHLGESSTVSYMSSALTMSFNDMEGRHIITKQRIPKGSVAFVEKPFVCILLPDYFLTHCQKCLVPASNPLPCDLCIDVVWCSEVCKLEGNSYHRFECGNLHILAGVGVAQLALRIILMAGWKTCMQIKQEFSSTDQLTSSYDLFNDPGNEASYSAVYSLLTHLDKVTSEDYLQYCLAALLLGQTLIDQWPSFFDDAPQFSSAVMKEENPVSDETLVQLSSVLVHHISQLVSNAYAITQIISTDEDESEKFLQISQNRMASAIYPSASLMNHACKPSIINSFHKDVLVIHTVEDLVEGQQIYNCYGPHAFRQEREQRQETLKTQYFFTCMCPHCTENEYLLKEGCWTGIKCPHCKGVAKWKEGSRGDDKGLLRCLECYKVSPPSKSIIESCSSVSMYFDSGEESLSKGLLMQAETDLENALKTAVKIYTEDNLYLSTIRDKLAKVYAMAGRYKDSLSQLTLCLRVIETRYGSESIEVAHELLKYLDILKLAFNNEKSSQNEMTEIRRRINCVFTINYGPQWKNYLKIKDV